MPKTSNEVLIKNKYYPSGLREKEINKYYQTHKDSILLETNNKNVVLVIAVDTNKNIIKRNINNKPIRLNEENYSKIIHPRVISIFTEMKPITNLWCIDIDSGGNVSEKNMKEAVKDVLKIFYKLYEKGFTASNKHFYRITSTASGYHVFGYMHDFKTLDKNYEMAEEFFSPLSKKYVFNSKKYKSTDIIIDLSPMRKRGSYQTPWALCRNGLICMDITYYLENFKRTDAIFKDKSK